MREGEYDRWRPKDSNCVGQLNCKGRQKLGLGKLQTLILIV